MILLAALAVFSGLSLNLLLSFALGIAGTADDKLPGGGKKRKIPLFQFSVFFISVLFLWVFFTFIMPHAWRGFAEYFLFFPLSALVCMGFQYFGKWIYLKAFPKRIAKNGDILEIFSAVTAYDGLVLFSLIITFSLAENFAGAVVISLFFVLGNMIAMLILNEIRRRSTLEWVPGYLRGSPLIIISMGLLSLISASIAGICFRILEIF